jgi:hypothetical protein
MPWACPAAIRWHTCQMYWTSREAPLRNVGERGFSVLKRFFVIVVASHLLHALYRLSRFSASSHRNTATAGHVSWQRFYFFSLHDKFTIP